MSRIYKNCEINLANQIKIIENFALNNMYHQELEGKKNIVPGKSSEIRREEEVSAGDGDLDVLLEAAPTLEEALAEALEKEVQEEVILPEDAQKQAEGIIEEARKEAQDIINAAMEEANAIKHEVEEDARKSGYDEGFELGKSKAEEIIEEAKQIRADAKKTYIQLLENMEKDIANVILEVSRKVIQEEVRANSNILLNLIKQAFDKCVDKQELVLKVSPKDYDFVVQNKEKILSMVEDVSDFSVKKDVALKSVSCVVETPFGIIDSGIEAKLKGIEEAFYRIVGKLKQIPLSLNTTHSLEEREAEGLGSENKDDEEDYGDHKL